MPWRNRPKPTPHRLPICAREIDRIDEAMHALLIERSEIIENLIAVKSTQESGSAFRPAREASMMRQLVERHHGILPLDTVESIWRVIIATFTHVQAPYSVHADLTAGEAAMRDSARFHFGFTVPFVPHMGAAGVIAAVAASKGDLGLVPGDRGCRRRRLVDRARRRQRAEDHRAAALRRAARPSGLAAGLRDLASGRRCDGRPRSQVYSVRVSGWGAAAARTLSSLAEVIAVPDGAFDGAALLVSVPQGKSLADITEALVKAGASVRSSALVGSHATRYTVTGDRPLRAAR